MILWRGIKKVMEEMGELLTVFGKLEVVPQGRHWDERYSPPLRQRCWDECGDLYAALDYFTEHNFTPGEQVLIQERRRYKRARFEGWVLSGIACDECGVPLGSENHPVKAE